MKVAIHQPNYIPWIGFFYKMANVDALVLLDNVKHSKSSLTHRNKIKSNNNELLLTIPLINKEYLINELIIYEPLIILKKHLLAIEANYSKAKYWKLLSEDIDQIYSKNWVRLVDLNIELINRIKDYLNIKCDIILASDLININGSGNERNLSICKSLNAKTYLSGLGAKIYNDEGFFKREGIDIIYTDFIHPIYPQLGNIFIPNLSVIDLLFNCGPDSKNYIFGK